ncbi:MAG: hypothetical protein KC488_09825 [Candidatus Cloacimonetes bacterium]|nr:hypothetical protein [Candidatus Cloacimonadota bacterium]
MNRKLPPPVVGGLASDQIKHSISIEISRNQIIDLPKISADNRAGQ